MRPDPSAAGYDAIVVGGGILGAAAGFHLTKAGLRTAVVDRADSGHATWAGAGIVCPVTATLDDPRLVDLAFAAAAYYPALADDLALPAGYQPSAMLSVSVRGAGAAQVARTAVWAEQLASTTDFADWCGFTQLTVSECRAHCPMLSAEVDSGLLVRAAQVDGHQFRLSLLASAVDHGLTMLPGNVDRISVAPNAPAVIVDGRRLDADYVVLCAGAWTHQLLAAQAASPMLTPVRGEILHLQIDGLDTSSWPLIEVEGTGPYVIPWPGGRFAVGTTFEPAPDFDARPTLAGIRQISAELERAFGGSVADAKLIECRVGLRPVTVDGLPIVGRWPGADRVLLATGHGANGLSWGPYSGKLVSDLITGRPAEIDLRPFAAGRFASAGGKEHA